MSTINFSHLRLLAIFVTVVERGSFAAAARTLRSSRSRISEQVADLEADLGVRLLQRSTRQLKITPEGQQVYERAVQLPDILHDIESCTRPVAPSGRVSITLNHDIAHGYLLPVLEDFQAQYPAIQLDLILDDSPLDLIDQQIDLGIRIGLPKGDSLIARVLHEERFALFASPRYLERTGIPTTLDDLTQQKWVVLMQSSANDVQHLRDEAGPIEIHPITFSRCNSPLMVQQMVIQGLGIGALLPTTVKHALAEGKLVPIMPILSSEPLTFALVYPSRRHVPARTRIVIDYLLSAKIFG